MKRRLLQSFQAEASGSASDLVNSAKVDEVTGSTEGHQDEDESKVISQSQNISAGGSEGQSDEMHEGQSSICEGQTTSSEQDTDVLHEGQTESRTEGHAEDCAIKIDDGSIYCIIEQCL